MIRFVLIAQVLMGLAVLLPQLAVESTVFPPRHRKLVRRLMLGFKGVVGRLMFLVQIIMHATMRIINVIVMG